MISLLDNLKSNKVWNDFLSYRSNKNALTYKEEKDLRKFIDNKEYKNISKQICKNSYIFNSPRKHVLISSNKKRIIYTYKREETYILKMVNYLLYEYDYNFPPNCYAFRKNIGVKEAIFYFNERKVSNLYGYKLDIKNYFNSIDTNLILNELKSIFKSDDKLYNLFESILLNKVVTYKDNLLEEDKGIMAGIPISPFLANVYLAKMDKFFYENYIPYLRYSDDIIVFGRNMDELNSYIDIINKYLKEYKLEINPDKEKYYKPHERIEFLGFSYCDGVVDLSDKTKLKLKNFIRSSSRLVRREYINNNLLSKDALISINNKINHKLYFNNGNNLNWSRWFFPIINTSKGLKEIDLYIQDFERYIITGKHNKKNYKNVPYYVLKQCGYKSLVNEYYLFKSRDNL